jgi:hypothetical protein
MALYPENYVPPAKVTFNISAATLIKGASGSLVKISLLTVAGTPLPAKAYDSATVGGIGAANELTITQTAVGVYAIDLPFKNGLVVDPGAGQTATVAFR